MKQQFARLLLAVVGLFTFCPLVYAQTRWKPATMCMQSRWVKDVNPALPLNEYPRPQLERKEWINLNGLWDYAIGNEFDNAPSNFEGEILVPYPLESRLSGVKEPLRPEQRLWYRRGFLKPSISPGEKVLLHFGAVDYQCWVYVNGKLMGTHEGGYTAFSLDITDALQAGNNELMVKVYDPSDKGVGPHGKQVLNPRNIYYTPSSGIWQTVWIEIVPATYIHELSITPDVDHSMVKIVVRSDASKLVTIKLNGSITSGKSNQEISIPIKNPRLWSPENPYLYEFSVTMGNDIVKSYFGMRKISVQKDEKGIDRIFLNNKPYFNLGTLDQGFWPDGLYTAPTDEALAFDIKAIKAMGFNTIRKHIKIEPARWYYYADKIGIMVWQDMVNPNQGLPQGAKAAFEHQAKETLEQLRSYPCITTWVLFNEKWGQYDQQRLTNWIKKMDPTRLVNGHSGEYLYVNGMLRSPSVNAYVSADMTDVHSYPNPMDSEHQPGKARVLGEFGGIGVPVSGHQWDDLKGWGYIQVQPKDLERKYSAMVDTLTQLKSRGLSGSIYTQPFDVEGEENGLMTYDREIIKIPLNKLRKIHGQLANLNTPGFKLDSQFTLAKNIDATDTDDRYKELLQEFEHGKRDSAFLRRLTLMALRLKDQSNATKVGNIFISGMKDPLSKGNLQFIYQITRTSSDAGFQIFCKQATKANAMLGTGYAETKVGTILDIEEIEPKIKSGEPDFENIRKTVIAKYGHLSDEYVCGKAMVYYWSRVRKESVQLSAVDSFAKYYTAYFKTALATPGYHINNITWQVFLHVNDPRAINFAVKVMAYAMEHWYQYDPTSWDTYANLLYKSGQTEKAIFWEKQAIRATKGTNKAMVECLNKMQQNLPTWPIK